MMVAKEEHLLSLFCKVVVERFVARLVAKECCLIISLVVSGQQSLGAIDCIKVVGRSRR